MIYFINMFVKIKTTGIGRERKAWLHEYNVVYLEVLQLITVFLNGFQLGKCKS